MQINNNFIPDVSFTRFCIARYNRGCRKVTLKEICAVCVDVHEAVGTGIVLATAVAIRSEVLPAGLAHPDVVEFEPLLQVSVVDVRPVVARRRLALVHEHRVQSVRPLQTGQKNQFHIKKYKVFSSIQHQLMWVGDL